MEDLKEKVHDYWNAETCGSQFGEGEKFSKEYFDIIEKDRYDKEPEIKEFANFSEGKDKKVLEVGVGAATDFLQWARSGAKLNGIDLTPQAIEHARHRLALYGFAAESLQVSDAENLPFEDNQFDIVYSWGVIHHSPNTMQALKEIIRVLKSGGKAKIMIYNRHSYLTYFFWVKHALLKFKWNLSLADVLWNNMESYGTKGYTVKEIETALSKEPVVNGKVFTYYTYYDKMERHGFLLSNFAKITAAIFGKKDKGWFLCFTFQKS